MVLLTSTLHTQAQSDREVQMTDTVNGSTTDPTLTPAQISQQHHRQREKEMARLHSLLYHTPNENEHMATDVWAFIIRCN